MSNYENYRKYRGKCKELAELEVESNPNLRLVRGFYHCPWWGKQQHWWCVKPDGTIVDPTSKQFPSNGIGEYEEFDGTVECDECGSKFAEENVEAKFEGRYAFCSTSCLMRFVGL